jgi:hypothetical protein
MITDYKITEIFCATDEFSKKFDEEIENMPLLGSSPLKKWLFLRWGYTD